ncbi:HsdR family type I site-specific deoxyribonuclease [Pseudomonas putida]|uniref:type I restriction endonuclease subunit R n=1 Tax=Pseudomonas putida group TaxID=136845 RepID=UPI00156E87A6|nr:MULTISPECIES: HsdR family type I site-specific deoxyribonuclease [Pseudomonas putida group]MCE0991411.1 HsdR family type I site-specific deoxyribonuclease [Pseudomonas alloputida]QKL09579.1 HsdR family type I site-specific deoxyribonuclease [Pseudomonas putida]
MTTFAKESEFEAAVIYELRQRGWGELEVIKCPSEADLLANWKQILFENNRGKDRLNEVPLTDSEMQQVMEQIIALRTPLRLNGFINGKTVAITRDNPADTLHFGKEVSLKVYDRHEIAAGQSRYQIAQQPRYARASGLQHDRRGDLLLLINGMPVIHIELKKSGVPVSQAYNQIQKYARDGLFNGLFSLVQIFVAMEPDEALYLANPGPDSKFNKDYAFHWADFNNEPINNWKRFTSSLLSIPMAHQLIGFYTVADEADGVLKVMRSYQYYAVHAISDKMAKTDWKNPNRLGGYIWHTTGSGKTMTSFKSAQLIANSRDADKVVFLLDRVELGTQTLKAYRDFAGDSNQVQATENTGVLVKTLKSTAPADTLIVTSIQKMSRITNDAEGLKAHDLETMRGKRIVFIVDECHRSTFGDMLADIKASFSGAVFFGFSGTPIHKENVRKDNTTTDVFGDELHRYSIADGIRDKNVLGFDPYQVLTYRDRDLRQAVALDRAKAATVAEALADAAKKKVFNRYMNDVPMAGHRNASGEYQRGIEDYLPNTQYERDEHRNAVVEDIAENWEVLSQGGKFHAIFATSSITEAITYYRLMKAQYPTLRITALFDPHISDEDGGSNDSAFKAAGLEEIIKDYNAAYGQKFDMGTHANFKKDLAARLAHKAPYIRVEAEQEKRLDLLIVVNQMLTGFDSKWVNTLYCDKLLDYENIIQAFSRTNRLFGPDKPFGTIRYYRKPHTMKRNVDAAVKLYSGDKPIGLFADQLPRNLERLNDCFTEIGGIFSASGITDFAKLPDDLAARAAFAKQFNRFSAILEAAKIQGFTWDKSVYEFDTDPKQSIAVAITKLQYLTLLQRYKELGAGGGGAGESIPFDIDSHITEIDTGKIDADYMNSRFAKYLKELQSGDERAKEVTLAELHRSFTSLSQEDQKLAEIFLHDIQRGDVQIDPARTFRDYLTDYKTAAKDKEVAAIVSALGVHSAKLIALMSTHLTEANLNEYGRFDDLRGTVDQEKAKAYFDGLEGVSLPIFKVKIKAAKLLSDFLLRSGVEGS